MGRSEIRISLSWTPDNSPHAGTPETPVIGVHFMEEVAGRNPLYIPRTSSVILIGLVQIPQSLKHVPPPKDAVPTRPSIKRPRPRPRRPRPHIFDQIQGLDMYMPEREGEKMEAALERVAFVMEMCDSRRRRQRQAELGIRPRPDLPDDELDNAFEYLGRPEPSGARHLFRTLTTPFRRLSDFLMCHTRSRTPD